MVLRDLPNSSSTRNKSFSSEVEHKLFVQDLHTNYNLDTIPIGTGIISFLRGSGKFTINDSEYLVDSSNYLVVSSGSSTSISVEKNSTPIILFFARNRLNIEGDFSLLEQIHIDHSDGVLKSLSDIYSLSTSCASFQALKADLLCQNLLERFEMKLNLAEKEAGSLPLKKRSSVIDVYKRLDHAREWIRVNYSEPITLDFLAIRATMNPKHFLRMFKHAFSITPRQYIIQVRLEKARDLLKSSENVTAISRSVGYESLSSFSLLFKQRFGHNPTDFRKEV